MGALEELAGHAVCKGLGPSHLSALVPAQNGKGTALLIAFPLRCCFKGTLTALIADALRLESSVSERPWCAGIPGMALWSQCGPSFEAPRWSQTSHLCPATP